MKAIIYMFDSLNRRTLAPYADTDLPLPNFARLAAQAVTFENFYAGSMPCMPARRELHTGRYNFLHRSWGPLEPFDDSMPQLLREAGVHTHLASDHPHYWEDGGATYHTRYTTWECFRGQEGDPWKGVVGRGGRSAASTVAPHFGQDAINRRYMASEGEHPQTRTVDAGIEFIDTNAEADDWLLQLELFDPHEPFFAAERFRAADDDGEGSDWPRYRKVIESEQEIARMRSRYAALVSMCDASLGRVLDAMDRHSLWDDTLLIVNTDHGFLLGEHGWWAKSVQPWFNELVHLPMFLWDPRVADPGTRRGDVAQTIDIAPTVLRWFGLEPPPDMQGEDLGPSAEPAAGHAGALFGIHGGHVNVTDGRYVYMRAAVDEANQPLEEFTLMPTHMKSRFSVGELDGWEPSQPFRFTKGLRTMAMHAEALWLNPWQHGTLLFDLQADPGQQHPIADDEVELAMLRLLATRMRESEAPPSQFQRLGIPPTAEPGPEHLLVRIQAGRAAAMAEPIRELAQLARPGTAGAELLTMPVQQLLARSDLRCAVEEHLPGLVGTELVAASAQMTLLDAAATGAATAEQVRGILAHGTKEQL
ncbi:MAG: sulfatase [Beutenbergiaceae bacterium]